jgi:hypothetical protein
MGGGLVFCQNTLNPNKLLLEEEEEEEEEEIYVYI